VVMVNTDLPRKCPWCLSDVARSLHDKEFFFCRRSCERRFKAWCRRHGQEADLLIHHYGDAYMRTRHGTRSESSHGYSRTFPMSLPDELNGPFPPNYLKAVGAIHAFMLNAVVEGSLRTGRNFDSQKASL